MRIPLLHLADATATAVRADGLSTVGLLGTAFTMEQDFYRNRLARHGLRVLVPDAADRAEVHRIIYDELCLGVVRPESRQVYREVIGRLVDAGAQGVILASSEVRRLVGAEDSSVRAFPATRRDAEAAITAALDVGPLRCPSPTAPAAAPP